MQSDWCKGCDEETAEKIIGLRPFRNVEDVYRKLDNTPKLSRRLYDNCESLMAVCIPPSPSSSLAPFALSVLTPRALASPTAP